MNLPRRGTEPAEVHPPRGAAAPSARFLRETPRPALHGAAATPRSPRLASFGLAGLGPAGLALSLAVLLTGGCASPGPPHSPSLNLPKPVTDLSAQRIGDTVELHFTAPSRSTDKLPLRSDTLQGVLCRAVEHQACVAVAGFSGQTPIAVHAASGGPNLVTWRDRLPAALSSGPHQLLTYRVEFFNGSGHSAGKSEPAYTASGDPPPAVEDLRAEGSRAGVVLRWSAAPRSAGPTQTVVLLEREDLSAADHSRPARQTAPSPGQGTATGSGKPKPHSGSPQLATGSKPPAAAVVWLDSNSSGLSGTADPTVEGKGPGNATETLDTTAEPGVAYRYQAVRRMTITLGGRSLVLRSASSAPVEITLREIYAPPTPAGLTAAGYYAPSGTTQVYSVDLIWQPVDSAGLLAGLGGYNVYRAAGAAGASAPRTRLNSAPVALPAFHDVTASPSLGYRYFVTAVDGRGNESSPVSIDLLPSPEPPPAGVAPPGP